VQLYHSLVEQGNGAKGMHALILALEQLNNDVLPKLDPAQPAPDPLELREQDLQTIRDTVGAKLRLRDMSSSRLWGTLDTDANGNDTLRLCTAGLLRLISRRLWFTLLLPSAGEMSRAELTEMLPSPKPDKSKAFSGFDDARRELIKNVAYMRTKLVSCLYNMLAPPRLRCLLVAIRTLACY
jgi:hypothetical protein